MREIFRVAAGSCLMCVLLVTASYAGSGDSNPTPFQDKHSKDILRAMDDASTWGHPDQEGEYQGVLHFAKGDYAGAMKYFLDGARYADKLSQLCIGLMYLNGNGVQKDPVTAYAWFAIAAERKYPKFVNTRDQVWAQLNDDQRKQATALAEKLSLTYGDAVAKPRMRWELMHDMLQSTMYKDGFNDGRINLLLSTRTGNLDDWNNPTLCATSSIGGTPSSGCESNSMNDSLKPSVYFHDRDATWTGIVTVGPLQQASMPKTQPATQDQQNGP
jgi:uncharacterized protein